MFKTLINAWKASEIRKKVLWTFLLIIIFRFGSHISVPFINFVELDNIMQNNQTGLLGLINMITGGAFERLSIFALSISPYITSSIILQLMGMIIPALERMMKEGGPEAKKRIDKISKIITIVLAAVQGLGLYLSYAKQDVFMNPSFITGLTIVTSFIVGTCFLVYLGEKITSLGIGNGISMLIFAGIVSSLPNEVIRLTKGLITEGRLDVSSLLTTIAIVIMSVLMLAGTLFVQEAERRVPVQYAKKVVGRKMYGGQNTYIPLKLVMAGVMPVIFASSFITFPAMLIQMFWSDKVGQGGFVDILYKFSIAPNIPQIGWEYIFSYAMVYLLLIIGFTFFYTLAVFNPQEISNNIRQNGGFIPGIRSGKQTTDFLKNITNKLTLFGAIFLSFIAILPMFLNLAGINLAFAGTAILIVSGVALETIRSLESQLSVRHYKGFLD